MGWISHRATKYKNSRTIDRKAEIDALWNEEINQNCKVLKSSMVGSVYYGAIQVDENNIHAAICLTSVDMQEYYNFSYKLMDETMGPMYFDCPVGILKLLTKTDDEYANEWRRRCWENYESKRSEKKNSNSLKNLPVGTKISFIAKYPTNNSEEGEEIVLTKIQRFDRAIWYRKGFRWLEKHIKEISNGNYKIIKEVLVMGLEDSELDLNCMEVDSRIKAL